MFENGLLNLTNWVANVIMPTLAGLFATAAIYRFSKAQSHSHYAYAGFASLMCSGLLRSIEAFAQQAGANEAQAFKRACACFGLGRYLYHFRGTWVDLDQRKQPRSLPKLPEWATPDGWSRGLRPFAEGISDPRDAKDARNHGKPKSPRDPGFGEITPIVQKIEAMQKRLGNRVYRGMLKDLARVWNPREIQDPATQQ